MARVLITRALPGNDVERLVAAGHEVTVLPRSGPPDRAALLAAVAGYDALMPQLDETIDAALLDACGAQLVVVANYAVGYNNIDVSAATDRGVWVGNTPGVLTDATADITWTLILAVARRAVCGDRRVRDGGFDGWSPEMLLGLDLHGRTLALVGPGRIASAVAERATGWRMRIRYVGRQRKVEFERRFDAERWTLAEALAGADVLSLHVPLTEETYHMVGAQELAAMKSTAILINTSRGPVLDEQALVDALQRRTIAGAGLDVYEHEPLLADGLAACESAVLLPHLGSATHTTRSEMTRLAVDNVLAVLAGGRPAHAVNHIASPR